MKENLFMGIQNASSISTALKHTGVFEGLNDRPYRLAPEIEMKRVYRVVENELTITQRDIVLDVLDGKSLVKIARERGVDPSTVSRTFHRAIKRLRRFLQY